MAVIIDFNQIIFTAVYSGHSQFGDKLDESMIRHIFLSNISDIRQRFISKYDDPLIIACDGKGNWRKDVFPYYKIRRMSGRKDSAVDWDYVLGCVNKIYDEMDEYFPYKVVKVDGAEGDDVIAVLVKYFQTNELIQDGLLERKQKILIISSDKDFLQLQTYDNVKQYSPNRKTLISEADVQLERYTKIIKGDSGDDVMNIFSDEDVFVTDKRQVPATKKKIEPILESLMATGELPDNLDDSIKESYYRNKKMIDLLDYHIPKEIENSILETYKNANNTRDMVKLHGYFAKHNLINLYDRIGTF